jgi:uncharacterized protein (TIGR01777 family)
MKIIISGASGLVGSALVPALEGNGHEVIRLVRPPRQPGPSEALWDPAKGELDPSVLDGADAVVNLNGRNIGAGRWNPEVKEALRASRLDSTSTLVQAIGRAADPPSVLVSASATGIYGDRGDETLDESSARGEGFLADLTHDWEQAALDAGSNRTRVVMLRFGMILADDGALAKMLPPFKLGAGGPIGNGRQFWPWVALDDACGIIEFAMTHDTLSGPVNSVAPQATRCAEFTKTLGKVLRRPAVVPLPAFAARLALGEMADALLLASSRVRPTVLEENGYRFRQPELEGALRAILGR